MSWHKSLEDALRSVPIVPVPYRGRIQESKPIPPPSICLAPVELLSANRTAGGGASFAIGNVILDFGANPIGGHVAKEQMERMIRKAVALRAKQLGVSHYHLDHCGGVCELYNAYSGNGIPLPLMVCSKTTWRLMQRNLLEAGLVPDGPKDDPKSVFYAERTEELSMWKNKHSVPGAVSFLYQDGTRKILYTGDFWRVGFPRDIPEVDLCIVDSTGGSRDWRRDNKERYVRNHVMALTVDRLSSSPVSKVFIATFSTQLKRISHWQELYQSQFPGFRPCIEGTSMYNNLLAYQNGKEFSGIPDDRVAICTGAWAQGEEDDREGMAESRLVKMSKGIDRHYRIKPGDLIILSASMPIWDARLMACITTMCERLRALGAEVIVDTSLPLSYMPWARREEVHCGGHAHLPEIEEFLLKLKPKKVFATHGDRDSIARVEALCREHGLGVVSIDQSLRLRF